MSLTTSGTEDGTVLPRDQFDSSLVDEGNSGGSCGGSVLKKGPWTSAEDAILMDYVKTHGEGNWNAVQKHSGLSRCGKSCRLRWANHLRPNLKKGAFTPDEERLIIELHAKMGNKWARMAAHLPGRTDNEIKNYWNTRIKRRQRAGLPLYPPEVCLQVMQEGQQIQGIGGTDSEEKGHGDLLQPNSYELHGSTFNCFKDSQVASHFVAENFDIYGNKMLGTNIRASSYQSLLQPTFRFSKRLKESTSFYPYYDGNSNNVLPLFDQTPDDTYDKISRSCGFSFQSDSELNTRSSLAFDANHGCCSYLNGNLSALRPDSGTEKLELPSFQYLETDLLSSWGASSPPHKFESVDTFTQSPPTETVQAECVSPRNSGLLDALLHEARTLSSGPNHPSDKSSNSSGATSGGAPDNSSIDVSETGSEHHGDPKSTSHAAGSVISKSSPGGASASSSTENMSCQVFAECNVKSEPIDLILSVDEQSNRASTELDLSRPDALLGSGWFTQGLGSSTNQASMTDALVSFLGDELSRGYKKAAVASPTPGQPWVLGSCAWNNMPAVCQMSENS